MASTEKIDGDLRGCVQILKECLPVANSGSSYEQWIHDPNQLQTSSGSKQSQPLPIVVKKKLAD